MPTRDTGLTPSYAVGPDIAIYMLLAVMFGFLIVTSIKGAVLLTFAFFVSVMFLKSPLAALSVLIVLIPFSATGFLSDPIAGLKGVKALHIFSLFVVLIAMLNYKQSSEMPKYALVFTIVYLAIFSISAIQSLTNMDSLNLRWVSEDRQNLSTLPFILKVYVKPLIMFIPFVLIIKYCRTADHVRRLANMLVLSLVILSVYLVYLNLFEIEGGVAAATVYYGSVIGHRNNMARFFIIGFPFLLANLFLKKNVISLAIICLSVASVGFLYSRTAYVLLVLSFIFYFVISKRTKYLPILMVIAIGMYVIVPTSIVERASKGIESGDVSEISAGRIDNIWLPLIDEYMQNPEKLLFGDGRYAAVSSAVAKGHPHNMYLEQIIDAGIFALIFILCFFVFFLRKAYKTLNNVRDGEMKEYLYAAIVSMTCYFGAGFSGGTLFPSRGSAYFWIVVGLTTAIVRLVEQSRENGSPETVSSQSFAVSH